MSIYSKSPITAPGWKAKQAASQAKRERNAIDPEVKAARARMMEERQAVLDRFDAEAKAEKEANPTALQAILSRGSIDELAEVSRSIGRMDPRKLEELANESFRIKSRSQAYQPDVPVPAPVASAADVAEIALGAGGSVKASSTHRKG